MRSTWRTPELTVLWRKLHAQAMVQHVFPQLFTQAEGGAMKAEILREIERVQHTLTVRLFGMLLGFTALAIPVAKAL